MNYEHIKKNWFARFYTFPFPSDGNVADSRYMCPYATILLIRCTWRFFQHNERYRHDKVG